MKRTKYIKSEIVSLEDFLNMVGAYEEISAISMRKVKRSILERREFMQGLNEAFAYIAYAYKQYRASLKGKARTNVLNTNNRTISVLMSSNTGLYGEIIRTTFDLFAKDVKEKDTDLAIVGRVGKKYYDASGLKKSYQYFDLPDNKIDETLLSTLLNYVINYTEVIIYHGVFKSILSQEASATAISGEVMKIEKSLDSQNVRFLFEPSIEKVAEHFEKQIASLIFEQAVFESSLSKFASRMISLDKAAENIGTKIHYLNFNLRKSKHKKINSNLQAGIFGGILWR